MVVIRSLLLKLLQISSINYSLTLHLRQKKKEYHGLFGVDILAVIKLKILDNLNYHVHRFVCVD